MVAGFSRSEPNPVLMRYATAMLAGSPSRRLLDVGCGAGRNAVPLAHAGWRVVGTDLSLPMIVAAGERVRAGEMQRAFMPVLAPMEQLPIRSRSVDFIVAHGIWNLARSDEQLRLALQEAARVARVGARLFVFTFSRHTLPDSAAPVAGQTFAFTQFSGEPQIFLTDDQLVTELASVGFVLDEAVAFSEYNRRPADAPQRITGPVIYEAAFRFEPDQR
jgi:ubiquinone/menaquinone biosynthesis C-methylase UbiE